MLENRKVPHKVFLLPEEKLGALEAARQMGVSPELVYKTIVVVREKPGKPILAVIPGTHEVDLKALAQTVGEKKVHVPTEKEAEKITGLLAGGISPLALINRGFQILVDISVRQHEEIHISGGQRGINIRLPVHSLIELANARIAQISKPESIIS